MLTYKGDLNLCLKYVTSEQLNARRQVVSTGKASSTSTSDIRGGELLVLVKQARNLTAVRSNGFSDPFCKWSALSTLHLDAVCVDIINKKLSYARDSARRRPP